MKTSFIDPSPLEKPVKISLKSRILQAKIFFKHYSHKNLKNPKNSKNLQNSQHSQNPLKTASFSKESLDIYSFLKHQERRIFLNKTTNPFSLFKPNLDKNVEILAKKPNSLSLYKTEKKLLEDYLENPQKTLKTPKMIKSFANFSSFSLSKKRLFTMTNPENPQRKSVEFSSLYDKMSQLREKFDLHASYHWESLLPLNNEFLQKKELGLENFYKNSQKIKAFESETPVNMNNSSGLKRMKSYFSPKMSLLRSAALKKTILRGSGLIKTKENLFRMNSIDEEDLSFKGKNTILQGKDAFSCKIPMNLKERFEFEKLHEYQNSLQIPDLSENEVEFLEFVKRNDVKNVEKMARINRNLAKIRDRVNFLEDFLCKGLFSIF